MIKKINMEEYQMKKMKIFFVDLSAMHNQSHILEWVLEVGDIND